MNLLLKVNAGGVGHGWLPLLFPEERGASCHDLFLLRHYRLALHVLHLVLGLAHHGLRLLALGGDSVNGPIVIFVRCFACLNVLLLHVFVRKSLDMNLAFALTRTLLL